MTSTARVIIVTCLSFCLYFFLDEAYFVSLRSFFHQFIPWSSLAHTIAYIVLGFPMFTGILLMHGAPFFWFALGLNKGVKIGVTSAFFAALPMLIGYAMVFPFNAELSVQQIITGALCAAFFEELYYRGVLFGQLFRFTNLGFIPSILLGALLFASAHLYQSQELSTLVGVFITTFMGAFLFGWLFIEWEDNLWIPIFLHLFMNLFWMMFSAGDNALGGLYANIFRSITIAIAIIGTLRYKRRKKLSLAINRNTLWIKRQLP